MKKPTLKTQRADALYTNGLILHGNNKLKDFDDVENGVKYRYAQFNTRALLDCPFKTAGCSAVCYGTKGNHNFPDVKQSRENSRKESRREDFTDAMLYTIKVEKQSRRYENAIMLIRIHETGDFYSLQYLRKWVNVWRENIDGVRYVFYTKSFPFFLMLTEEEKEVINKAIENGRLAMNLSMDDTTTIEQKTAYLNMLKTFPKANTYYCTEHVDEIQHDAVCDCANCAKCGTCNKGTGRRTVVKIHSASRADMDVYRKNIK